MRWICDFRGPRSGKLEAPIASEGPGMDCLIGPPLSARLSHSRRAPVNQQLAASGWLLGAGRGPVAVAVACWGLAERGPV